MLLRLNADYLQPIIGYRDYSQNTLTNKTGQKEFAIKSDAILVDYISPMHT